MERSVAVRKLEKLLGKKLGYRVNPKAPTSEKRESARTELDEAILERKALQEKRDARYKTILAADQEYQELSTAYKIARERADKLSSLMHSHRFTVGTVSDLAGFSAFHVRAQGDSWEEVIEKLQTEKQKTA